MYNCTVCSKPDVPEEEVKLVSAELNSIDIEQFEDFVNAAGIADCWQTAVVCKTCYEYYIA